MQDSVDAGCVQLEREYRLLSENAMEAILVYDIATAKFVYASPSTVKLRGFTAEETIRQTPGEFMPPESLQRVSETARLLYERFSAGERRADMLSSAGDYEIFCRDGALKHVEVILRLVSDEKAGAFHMIGISRDITKRKLLEEQLNREVESKNEVIRRLSESEKMLKELTGELDRKNKILNVLAARDALTGICNRYSFDQRMYEELDRSRRYRFPLSVVLLDLDHFKNVNDTFGHLAGDRVLVEIADAVTGLLRKQDVFARWGGEEFVVLMPQTPLSAAAKVGERIRKKIEGLRHRGLDIAVTVSLGVTEFMHGETAESFFKRADYALYQAKSAGRNRIASLSWENAIPMAQVRLEWKDEWACGSTVIDGQHRELVFLGNQLLTAAFRDCSSEETARALEALIAHIAAHFDSEERILRQSGYPDVDRHAEIHRQLVGRTKEFRTQFQTGSLRSTAVFSFLLDEVIVGHLLTEDILFFHWLKERG